MDLLFPLPCVEDGGAGRLLGLREARGYHKGRDTERPAPSTAEGGVQGRGEQGWGHSPSGDGPQMPVMSCAMLSTALVNTQMGGENHSFLLRPQR